VLLCASGLLLTHVTVNGHMHGVQLPHILGCCTDGSMLVPPLHAVERNVSISQTGPMACIVVNRGLGQAHQLSQFLAKLASGV
jgi:hypothetical protein